MRRILGPVQRLATRGWHMLPVGFLFGLGFDTATEVALLALTARQSAAGLSAADVFVFPSLTDTFGLVVLEALACGLPVAAFPVAGPKDILAGSNAGALHLDLAIAVERALMVSPETCRAWAERYTWRAATEQFPGNAFASTIPLNRMQRLSWQVRLGGAATTPEVAHNPLASSLPHVDLRRKYSDGLAAIAEALSTRLADRIEAEAERRGRRRGGSGGLKNAHEDLRPEALGQREGRRRRRDRQGGWPI